MKYIIRTIVLMIAVLILSLSYAGNKHKNDDRIEIKCPKFNELTYNDGKYSYHYRDYNLLLESSKTSKFSRSTKFSNFIYKFGLFSGKSLSCQYTSPTGFNLSVGSSSIPEGIFNTNDKWEYEKDEILHSITNSCNISRDQCVLYANKNFGHKDFYIKFLSKTEDEKPDSRMTILYIQNSGLDHIIHVYKGDTANIKMSFNNRFKENYLSLSGYIDNDNSDTVYFAIERKDNKDEPRNQNCDIKLFNSSTKQEISNNLYKCQFHGETFYIDPKDI